MIWVKEKVDGHPSPRVEVINVIVKEIAAGGDSNFVRKSYALGFVLFKKGKIQSEYHFS